MKFFNVPGSKNPNMVEVKTVTVKPSLGALLTGNVEVSEVTLVEPKIVLEINAEGKPNWEFTPSVAEAKPAAPKPASPKPLSLGRLTIDNGTLIFSDSKAGLSVVAEKANFSASVRSLDGPYSIAGSATINGAPLKLDLSVGAKAADGHAVDLALEAGGKLSLKGKLSELGPNARFTGIASSASDNLIGFADTLIKMTGQPQPDLPPLLAGKFTFDGAIDASQTAISIRDFKLALGQDNAGGSLSLTLKPALAIEGKLAADRLDLDRWLAAMAKPATPQAPADAAAGRRHGRTGAAGGAQPARLDHRQAFLRDRRGDLQQAAGAQHRARARGAPRRRRRAEAHRHPAGRSGAAGQVDPVGRSQPADRRRRFQPGRAEAARDAGLARGRRARRFRPTSSRGSA